MEISAYILKPKNIIFALEDNKKDIKKIFYKEFKNFSPLLFAKDKFPSIEVKILKSYYPQGAEKQLIFNTVRRIVPAGGLPFDVGVVVQNVSTLFSIYEALYKDKPLIERLVSFAGSSLKEPKNLWVKIGTLLSDLIEAGDLSLRKSVKKVIFGGPMMGISQDSLDIPILKGTGGVLLFSEEEINIKPEYNCIRCARCIKACPMGLLPCEIYKYAKHQDIENLKKVYPQDCIECGCCSFVCPSGINLVQYIKWAKTVV
ncbi:MAG: hypothetical protein B6D55_08325 [Candidatus Omnitrophica bacterium 4484_70.2]|nr:MAG: hypothetical protein B6D55_08325 [Candidatus Omnitrophica bacterium 4484_70.2]